MDKSDLTRWRSYDAVTAVLALAEHAKRDASFVPTGSAQTQRWHVSVGGHDFELLLTGPKFWDTRGRQGGGGAVDLAMHLLGLDFKGAVRVLAERLG